MGGRSFLKVLPERLIPDFTPPVPMSWSCLRCKRLFTVPEEGSAACYAGVAFPLCLPCGDRVRPFMVRAFQAVAEKIAEI